MLYFFSYYLPVHGLGEIVLFPFGVVSHDLYL